jgi:NAD(P)H dehydrogenase (quinone)
LCLPPLPLALSAWAEMLDREPVRALIIYAHPEPTSFCGAMRDVAVETLEAAGLAVEVSDLYGEHFNPVAGRHDFLTAASPERFHYQTEQLAAFSRQTFAPDIVREQGRVARADMFVFVFPLWWGGVPATLKGWFDRVLAYGFAYADGKRYEHGYFKTRRGLLGITTGGTRHRFSAGGSYGEISSVLHGVQHCMLNYLGLDTLPPFVAYAAPRVTDVERHTYLRDWREWLTKAAQDKEWLSKLSRSSGRDDLLRKTSAGAAGRWARKH